MTDVKENYSRSAMVNTLARVLKEVSPEEITEITEDVKIKLAIDEAKQYDKLLSQMFDAQLNRLEKLNCPLIIIAKLNEKRDQVLSKAMEMNIDTNHIAFIPVVPSSYLGFYVLTSMIKRNKLQAYTRLNPGLVIDKVKIPEKPYYLLDVEVGAETLGVAANMADELIQNENRSSLTFDEGAALCTHSKVSDHDLNFYNSWYKDSDLIVGTDKIEVTCVASAKENERRGTPSYAKRV